MIRAAWNWMNRPCDTVANRFCSTAALGVLGVGMMVTAWEMLS